VSVLIALLCDYLTVSLTHSLFMEHAVFLTVSRTHAIVATYVCVCVCV
jgi:hypothetical protein